MFTHHPRNCGHDITLTDFTQAHKSSEKSRCLTLRDHYASTGIFRELETYRTVLYLAVVSKAVEVSGVARVTFVRALSCHVIQNNTLQLVRNICIFVPWFNYNKTNNQLRSFYILYVIYLLQFYDLLNDLVEFRLCTAL